MFGDKCLPLRLSHIYRYWCVTIGLHYYYTKRNHTWWCLMLVYELREYNILLYVLKLCSTYVYSCVHIKDVFICSHVFSLCGFVFRSTFTSNIFIFFSYDSIFVTVVIKFFFWLQVYSQGYIQNVLMRSYCLIFYWESVTGLFKNLKSYI